MPIEGLDLVITAAFTVVFVLPMLAHLASDLWQRRGRSFSLIPHKTRHLVASVFRFGLVCGAGVLSTQVSEPFGDWARVFIWCILGVFLLAFNALGATDRRLTINAATGVVKWKKISLPWWPSREGDTGFVDRVGYVHFRDTKRAQSLLGVGELKRRWSTGGSSGDTYSGHYSKGTMVWIAKQVNDYLEAFGRHDSETARAARDRFREQVEAADAPRREREAARAKSAQREKADKKKLKEDKRVAKAAEKERERVRRVEDKFKS